MKTSPLVLALALAVLLDAATVSAKRAAADSPKACVSCEEQKNALASGAYGYAAMDHIWPPAFPVSRGITVAVQLRPETKNISAHRRRQEAGRKVEDVAREVGVSKHTIYAWKAKYGGMDVSQAQEAKQLRDDPKKRLELVATRYG